MSDSNQNKRTAKDYLRDFSAGLNESINADRNRSVNTERAMNQGTDSSSSSSKTKDKVSSQFASLGKDIAIQPGTRSEDWVMPGVKGKKGFMGHVARAAGVALAPATGGLSLAAGNFAGDRLDYV